MYQHNIPELEKLWNMSAIDPGKRDRAPDLNIRVLDVTDPITKSTAEFGDDKDEKSYHTSLYSCTCESFAFSRTPCKHMIRLALESGFCTMNDLPDDEPTAVGQSFKNIPKTEKDLTLFRISMAMKIVLIEGFNAKGIRILPMEEEQVFFSQVANMNRNGGLLKNFKALSPLFKMSYTDFVKKYACKPDNALRVILPYEK